MTDWMELRACIGMDPAVFFPPPRGRNVARAAKAVCASCDVRDECLAYALEHRETEGIWGGLTARERGRLQKPPARPPVALCGTDAGYYRHLRRTRTEPCVPCREAHAAAARARKGHPSPASHPYAQAVA